MEKKGPEQKTRYVNHSTGAPMEEKPEHMTELTAFRLVEKDHPRIQFRGRLDLLEGRIVTAQALLAEREESPALIEDLEDVVALLRTLVRSEVLDEAPAKTTLIGLTPQELRAQSHDPKGIFGVEPMLLPHYKMGVPYALLNELRAESRVLETMGVAAFRDPTPAQTEILRWLNRISSALHILMCRVLAGRYGG